MTASRCFIMLAALYGVAGVSLMAAGSHAGPGNAVIAGQMLLFHAPALIAAVLALDAGALHRAVGLAALILLVTGVGLFSLDLSLRASGTGRLFALAAPAGGSLTISGWLALALAAFLARTKQPE